MFNILKLSVVALGLTAFITQAQAGDYKKNHTETKAEAMIETDIVETAMSNPDFSTLVTALKEADLVEALKGEGPFTVFAPTNDAFASLPEGTLDNLLMEENKAQLAAILKYHVLPAKIMAGEIPEGINNVDTLEGSSVTVTKNEMGVSVDEANVIKADIKTSNGVIHVIDNVIIPEAE